MSRLSQRLRRAGDAARLVIAGTRERLESGRVFNPISSRFRADPYRVYRRFREQAPVHRAYAAYGWAVFRHADCLEVLRDPRLSADDRHFQLWERDRARAIRDGLAAPDEPVEPVMLRSDPPRHTRLRGLVNKAFTARAVAAMRPRLEELAEELVAGLPRRFDLIEDFAVPFPVTVIAEMLGIPAADRATFKRWSDALVGFLDPVASPGPAVLRKTLDEFFAYIHGISEQRRREPGDDLLSALLRAEEAGDRLSERELLGTVALLLAAGNETTTNLIGNGMLALLEHPDQLARLRGEPELLDTAVEELLRWDSPVQLTARIPTEDFDFHGHPFRRGQAIVAVLGSANRDPEQFPEPERLDLARRDNRHLSFGHGHHFCLGAPLARLEGRTALEALLRRFPELRRAGSQRLRWRPFTFLRGLEALPLEAAPAAEARPASRLASVPGVS